MLLPADIERLAVIMPSWVGDIVMATPTLRHLRAACPGAKITAAIRPGLDPLLGGLTDIDDILIVSPRGLMGPFLAGRKLAASRPDAVVILPNSMRSAIIGRLSSSRIRIGFARQGRRGLLTQAVKPPMGSQVHTTLEDYLYLAGEATGFEPTDPRVSLVVVDAERQQATSVIDPARGRYVVLIPGGNRLDKRWPAVNFARVAERISHTLDLRVVMSGSPAEQPLLQKIAALAACDIVSLPGTGGLGPLKAVLAEASVVITNDTGPRHIAAGVGTPIVSLFGPTDHRWTILPGVKERRLLAEPFLPDTLVADRCARICRIDRITVNDVYEAVERSLDADAATTP